MGSRSCFKRNLISVCTLRQSSEGTSRGLTNIKWNWNKSRSDWKCSPVHNYWLNQPKWTFSTLITEGVRYVYPRVGEWVTRCDLECSVLLYIQKYVSPCKTQEKKYEMYMIVLLRLWCKSPRYKCMYAIVASCHSHHGNPLWGGLKGHRWIPLTRKGPVIQKFDITPNKLLKKYFFILSTFYCHIS